MDLGSLVTTGATTLVAAMATSAWAGISARVGMLFGRDGQAQQREANELEELNARVLAADEEMRTEVAREVTAELRGMLRARLRDDPALSEPFNSLVAAIREELVDTTSAVIVRQSAQADRGGHVYQAGRDITLGRREDQ